MAIQEKIIMLRKLRLLLRDSDFDLVLHRLIESKFVKFCTDKALKRLQFGERALLLVWGRD
jgi:hypothetical protein